MAESARIVEQMRRLMFGVAWHGPSVFEALDGVSATAAAAQPIAGAHSIWGLVLHIDKVQQVVLARLKGENPNVTDAEYFPPVSDKSEAAWKATVTRLKSQEEQLLTAASKLTDEQLAAPITPGGSTVYETLHGHAQHNAFHAGQIKLLRKVQNA